jgi:lysophospholipid acyltransferase (LPLAT)-like uncharacterized protein
VSFVRRFIRSERLREALCFAIALYIRIVHATGRWRIERADIPRRLHESGTPFILAFWHGRLLMMPMIWSRDVPIFMLISAHRDGRIIADAVKHFRIASIAGSSTRGGSSALRQMLKTLKSGACVGVTPDGPRGPAMVASEGIVAASRLARLPIVPATHAARRRIVLRTWDRFHLALPFSSGVFLWGEPIAVPQDAADLEPWRLMVEERLNALGEEADKLAGLSLPSPLPAGESEGPAAQRRENEIAPLLSPGGEQTQ